MLCVSKEVLVRDLQSRNEHRLSDLPELQTIQKQSFLSVTASFPLLLEIRLGQAKKSKTKGEAQVRIGCVVVPILGWPACLQVGVQDMVRQDDRFDLISGKIFKGLQSAFDQVRA